MSNKNIEIQIKEVTSFGALFPKYDKETGILEVTGQKSKDWKYGFDVDGNIVFDVDEDFIIENFDLLIPKKLWKIDKVIPQPHIIRPGILKVNEDVISVKSFHKPCLRVASNKERSTLLILFEKCNVNELDGISTSPFCMGLVRNNELVGFILKLM